MFLTSLMVVLIVHVVAIPAVEAEGNPPVSIDIDGPLPLSAAFEGMEPQPRGVEVPDACRCLKPGQNPTDLRNVVRIQTSRITGFKEPLQPAVPKPYNHSPSVTCNGSPVNLLTIPDAERWSRG